MVSVWCVVCECKWNVFITLEIAYPKSIYDSMHSMVGCAIVRIGHRINSLSQDALTHRGGYKHCPCASVPLGSRDSEPVGRVYCSPALTLCNSLWLRGWATHMFVCDWSVGVGHCVCHCRCCVSRICIDVPRSGCAAMPELSVIFADCYLQLYMLVMTS